jgi:hypothetical protein
MDALTLFQIQNMMNDSDFDFIADIKNVNMGINFLEDIYNNWDYTPKRFHYLEKLCNRGIKLTKEEWIFMKPCSNCDCCEEDRNIEKCFILKSFQYICEECYSEVRTKG